MGEGDSTVSNSDFTLVEVMACKFEVGDIVYEPFSSDLYSVDLDGDAYDILPAIDTSHEVGDCQWDSTIPMVQIKKEFWSYDFHSIGDWFGDYSDGFQLLQSQVGFLDALDMEIPEFRRLLDKYAEEHLQDWLLKNKRLPDPIRDLNTPIVRFVLVFKYCFTQGGWTSGDSFEEPDNWLEYMGMLDFAQLPNALIESV